MKFDLTDFLLAMYQVFKQCQKDGEQDQPRMLIKNGPLVTFVARRELRKQAKAHGVRRKHRGQFVRENLDEAINGLQKAVQERFPS